MQLSIKDISVSLSNKSILKSVSFTVEDGSFMSILGPSGCGKTTLLKTIAGIISQSNGSIILNEKCADKLPPYKRGTVIVFQDFRLFPHMTVEENISFPLRMRGVAKEEYLKIAAELLEKVQLKGLEKRKPHEMSGGQIQRVALARALAAKPSVLLLDEPFFSLDENLRQDMRSLVLNIQRELKITTVLVTHDWQEALSMSDKVALMMHGEILQYDTPEKIFEYPASREVAEYFGEAVYINGSIKDQLFQSDIISFSVDRSDGPYQAMFRPSAIAIVLTGEKNYRVCEICYKGEYYVLILANINNRLRVKANASYPCMLQIGDMVSVTFSTDKAVLFRG